MRFPLLTILFFVSASAYSFPSFNEWIDHFYGRNQTSIKYWLANQTNRERNWNLVGEYLSTFYSTQVHIADGIRNREEVVKRFLQADPATLWETVRVVLENETNKEIRLLCYQVLREKGIPPAWEGRINDQGAPLVQRVRLWQASLASCGLVGEKASEVCLWPNDESVLAFTPTIERALKEELGCIWGIVGNFLVRAL